MSKLLFGFKKSPSLSLVTFFIDPPVTWFMDASLSKPSPCSQFGLSKKFASTSRSQETFQNDSQSARAGIVKLNMGIWKTSATLFERSTLPKFSKWSYTLFLLTGAFYTCWVNPRENGQQCNFNFWTLVNFSGASALKVWVFFCNIHVENITHFVKYLF